MQLFGAEHVKAYRESDGAVGHLDWQGGVPCLILETKGRRSGEPRPTPLIYGEHDGAYVVVASKGGAPEPPAWFLNLVDEPRVDVQVGADRFDAVARTATAEEKAVLWPLMVEIWPDYEGYQTKTDRDIPVVLLERA